MGKKATGMWRGHYWFDPSPDWPEPPPRIAFQMQLRQSWLFGTIRGEVWDEEPAGMPGRGIIEGHLRGVEITFIKWMPIYYVWADNKPVSYQDYVLRQFGLVLDQPPPHPPIRYRGEYLSDRDTMEGIWEFIPGIRHVVSQGQLLECDIPPGQGKWSAARELVSAAE